MKQIILIFTLLCAHALHGMEPQPDQGMTIEDLNLEAKDYIITALTTYDNLDDIIYAIKAISMTSKTFMMIIDEKYGTPEKIKRLASTLEYNFSMKFINDYKAVYAQAYQTVSIWSVRNLIRTMGLNLINRDEILYSDYQIALKIIQAQPQRFELAVYEIIQKFKTPAARKYCNIPIAKNLLQKRFISADEIKKHIDDGLDPNYSDPKGVTPLLYLLQIGSATKVIQLLLESGADPHTTDNDNKGVFDYLDSGYPQNCEWNKRLKTQVHTLLEDALQKQQA